MLGEIIVSVKILYVYLPNIHVSTIYVICVYPNMIGLRIYVFITKNDLMSYVFLNNLNIFHHLPGNVELTIAIRDDVM